mmetsp:Transcript_32298/g.68773  ORF Transcript_32298/g.68773 Transcript_32298/m.68773 type:complete len:223 (+) Transcript_32298:65-733(+)
MALQFAGARAAARRRHQADARLHTTEKLRKHAVAAQERPQSAGGRLQGSDANAAERAAEAADPERYLLKLGLGAAEPAAELVITVAGHAEEHRCTWYEIRCDLRPRGSGEEEAGASRSWVCKKRLISLREYIHDPVKEALGDDYANHFCETPFARFGAPSGTTDRLRGWLGTLASCVNTGVLPPKLCAMVLRLLEAPSRDHSQGQVRREIDAWGELAATWRR